MISTTWQILKGVLKIALSKLTKNGQTSAKNSTTDANFKGSTVLIIALLTVLKIALENGF